MPVYHSYVHITFGVLYSNFSSYNLTLKTGQRKYIQVVYIIPDVLLVTFIKESLTILEMKNLLNFV